MWYNNPNRTYTKNYTTLHIKVQKRLNHLSTRNLSLKGRALVLNTLALSKCWYLASVIPMAKPSSERVDFEKKLEELVSRFIWKDKAYHLKKYTMYQPFKAGGLNIKSCSLQSKALQMTQINAIINVDIQKPWLHFARRWTHNTMLARMYPYTHFLRNHGQHPKLKLPGTTNKSPRWYSTIAYTAYENRTLYPDKDTTPTCKLLYSTLLKNMQKHTTEYNNQCIYKWENDVPRNYIIHWDTIWNTSYKGLNNNIQQDKLYKARHHILKTGEHLPHPPSCKYCSEKYATDIPDTHIHLGIQCPLSKKVWSIYEPNIRKILGKTNRIPRMDLFLSNFEKAPPLVTTVTSTVVHFLWKSRNDHRHNNITPHLTAIDRQIKASLRETVVLQYLIHKKNYNLDTFRTLFTRTDAICQLREDNTLKLII